MIPVASRVQDLQENTSARGSYWTGDLLVVLDLLGTLERAGLVLHAAGKVRCEAAGDDEAGAALRAFRVEAP